MKRVIVYDVDTTKNRGTASRFYKKEKDNSQNKEAWIIEKRQRALKTINNVSILNDVIKNIKSLKISTEQQNNDKVLKEAVETIASIVEEMKLEFKKDYWE